MIVDTRGGGGGGAEIGLLSFLTCRGPCWGYWAFSAVFPQPPDHSLSIHAFFSLIDRNGADL